MDINDKEIKEDNKLENFEEWFGVSGDLDDFIFFQQNSKPSEK